MSNPNGGVKMYYVRQSDGLAYCFSPVPLLEEETENIFKIKDGTETRIGSKKRLSFNGTLLPDVPALSGINPDSTCFELLDRKSDQLKSALSEDYGNLLIVDNSGYPAFSVYPRVVSLTFPESQIVRRRDYSLTFEYDENFEDGAKVSDFGETWDFSYQEDDTISVTHSVNAVGIADQPAGTGALENAKYFVLARANILDKGQSAFNKSPFVQASIDVNNLTEYNHIRSESIDESAGSYSVSESWILSSGNYKDDRTIDTSFAIGDAGNLVQTLTINGTVVGYGDTTTEKFNNAVNAFTSIVAPQIGFNSVTGISSKNRSDNRFGGSVSYSITYEDPNNLDAIENRSVERAFQRNDDGSVTQTVTTNAKIKLSSTSGIQPAIDFCFANNYPISNYIEPFFDASLSGNIESISMTRDDLNKSFSLVRAFRDQNTALYREEYQINREENVENATIGITVNGTVVGLGAESGTKTHVRFLNASGAFYGNIINLIRSRALELIPSGSCIGTNPISKTIGINKLVGTITYDYKFDNRYLTTNPNILDEQIDADYQLQADVIASIAIPAKADGPILQDQQTKTGLQKSLRVQYRMASSGTQCGPASTQTQYLMEQEALNESNILINNTRLQNTRGEKPVASYVYKTADSYSFNRRTLLFNRSVTWQYTPD